MPTPAGQPDKGRDDAAPGKPSCSHRDLWWLGVILVLCLAAGMPLAARCVNQIDNDGVSYLRLAGYYAQGHLAQAINGYWSPLLPWLMALLIKIGVGPMAAARAVILAAGCALTIGGFLLFGRLGLSRLPQLAATACVAAMAVANSVRTLSPDLLVTAIFTFYFWLSLDPDLLKRRGRAFKCGLVAGVGYLAKTYALPFFVLHFSVVVLLQARLKGDSSTRQVLGAIGLGVAGAALLALPWAATISVKYGRPTVGMAGAIVRRQFGPVLRGRHFSERGLWQPRGEALSRGEDPSADYDLYPEWSPLESAATFRYQLGLIREGLHRLNGIIAGTTRWYIVPGILLAILVLALFPSGQRYQTLLLYCTVWTILAFPMGYLWVVRGGDQRYYWPLEPLLIGLTFYVVQFLATGAGRKSVGDVSRPKWLFVVAVVTVAFLLAPAQRVARAWQNPPNVGVRVVADQMVRLSLRGPLAVNKGHEGYWLSYLLDIKYLGHPLAEQPQVLVAELQSARTGTFLLWDDEVLSAALDEHPDMRRLATIAGQAELAARTVAVFAVSPAGRGQRNVP